ncbi:probable serine/threonine-protein kinase clkA [Paramacrobiotus metropolitanus]|uniref:probable serine/threonine-protein kinase clkA n=1 Tax=Paramacrobiotus metropolitanus TaxID=2943436 RepID=UPI0024457CBE|nr:probable serine/threonine-protein kinase clkA [Paramacrobiotus metropolitanus]
MHNGICYSTLLRIQILLTIFSGYLAENDQSDSLSSRYRRQAGAYNYPGSYQPPRAPYAGSEYRSRMNYKVRTSNDYGPDPDYNSDRDNYDTGRYSSKVNYYESPASGAYSSYDGSYDRSNADYSSSSRYDNTGSISYPRGNRTLNYDRNDNSYNGYGNRNDYSYNDNRNYGQRLSYSNNTYGYNDAYNNYNSKDYSRSDYGRQGSTAYTSGRSSYGRNDYNQYTSNYRNRSYDNKYNYKYDNTCPKCPDCPPACNATNVTTTTPVNSTIQDFTQLSDLCDETYINQCAIPSAPFRCTAAECEQAASEGLPIKIFSPGQVNVSQCVFRKFQTELFTYDVCQQTGSSANVLNLTPDNRQNIDCVETTQVECLWAQKGSVYVRDPQLCFNLWSLTQPVTLHCSLYIWNDSGQVQASEDVEINVFPDCRC